MIIFSQALAKHSRIGNSFVWMCKFKFLLDELGVKYCFPWAVENFGFYFDESSVWMKKNYPDDFFKAKFNLEVSAKNISLISRKIEHRYERSHGLNAFEWQELVITDPELKLLYLVGKIDITDKKILELISQHEHTLIHEPFNFSFNNPALNVVDPISIAPKKSLYESQFNYINQMSGDKHKVGLHIRRGDYKSWGGGKYYFDDNYWISKAKSFLNNGSVVWIFTNEKNLILTNHLKDQGAFISSDSFEIDFIRMFFMNEIYGPPSTFSRMAVNLAKNIYGLNSAFHYLKPLQ